MRTTHHAQAEECLRAGLGRLAARLLPYLRGGAGTAEDEVWARVRGLVEGEEGKLEGARPRGLAGLGGGNMVKSEASPAL